jgi:hypothetical protein
MNMFFFSFSRNPTPGVIINHPKGTDVYKGVPHDYIGNVRYIQ